MGSEWQTVRLSDVADTTDYVANGSFESLRNNVTYRSLPDYAVLVRLVDHNAGWNGDHVYVDRPSYEFLRKSALRPGDIVIANVGANAGTVFRAPDLGTRMTLGPNAILCRPIDERVLRQDFLYYYLTSEAGQQSLRSIRSGSAQPKFNKTDLRSLRIPLPPLSDQRAIAETLGSLDDKIDLNRRMSDTLESMARALFKSWFIDFDPVRSKAEGRDPGLPAPLADLFPSCFDDSELGDIPKGWQVGPLDSVLVLQRGFDLPSSDRTPGAYPVLAASGPSGTHDTFMARGPGVTTGRSGVLGNVFYVQEDFWPLNTSLWVKEYRHSLPAYAYHLMRGIPFELFNAGSAVPTLNRNHVHGLPTLLPPMALIEEFERIASSGLRRGTGLSEQTNTITAVRDGLLPKLLEGRLLSTIRGPTLGHVLRTPQTSSGRYADPSRRC